MASTKIALKAIWPFAGVLVLSLLLTAAWFWVKGQAERGFAEQASMYESRPALTCGQQNWSGYPFKLKLDCASPVIHLNGGQTLLRPESLTGYIAAPNLSTILIEVQGPTLLLGADQPQQTTIEHRPTTIRVHVQPGSAFQGETELDEVRIKQSDFAIAQIDKLSLEADISNETSLDLEMIVNLVNLRLRLPEADPVVLADVETAVKVQNAPSGPQANSQEWMRAAAERSTLFRIQALHARYGATQLTAQGDLTITRAATLDGMLKTRVTDLDAFLNDLKQRQVLTSKQAQAASTLLGIFDNGSGIAADLRFKDKLMYWGPVNLGRQTPLF